MTTLFLAPTVIPELHIKGSLLLPQREMTGLSAAAIIPPQTKEATEGHKHSQFQYHHVFT